jgi:hypothetical protein
MNHKLPPLGDSLGYPSRRRDTAEACRGKAKDNLLLMANMPSGRHRELLERSAAAWSVRAEQLQREDERAALEASNQIPNMFDVRRCGQRVRQSRF